MYQKLSIRNAVKPKIIKIVSLTAFLLIEVIFFNNAYSAMNPYLYELNQSKKTNEIFNYFFQKSLEEKQESLKIDENISDTDHFISRYNAENYLVQIPELTEPITLNEQKCDLNNIDLYSYRNEESLPYPMMKPFPKKANEAFCLLQKTFQGLNDSNLKMINPIKADNTIYNIVKKDLLNTKNDTLVIIIPGIFGEFIDQLGFGEVFGQGLSKMDNPNFKSSFANQFNAYLKSINNKREDLKNNRSLTTDKRFLLKNLRQFYDSNDETKKFTDVNIDEWLKVSSLDDVNGKPLFKVALLGLAPMSLESIKEQKDLAIIYLNRLNKFMLIYNEIYKKIPNEIILVGYSRGTPVAYEMLTMLKHGPNPLDKNRKLNESDRLKEFKLEEEINQIAKTGNFWSTNISAVVSLGGVSLGTALADVSVIQRNQAPDQVKILQAFKRLMFNLKIVDKSDLLQLIDAYNKNLSEPSSTVDLKKKKIVVKVSSNISSLMINFTQKINTNLELFKEFFSVIKSTDVVNEGKKINKGIQALRNIYAVYAEVAKSLYNLKNKEFINFIAALNDLKTKIKTLPEFQNLSDDLMNVSITLFPKLTNTLDRISNLKSTSENDTVIGQNLNEQYNSPFTQLILKNYGLQDSKNRLITAINNESPFEILSEINLNIRMFQFLFKTVWNGASQLGTLQRLNWLMDNADRLPTDINYYSISAILNNSESDFYQSGINFGYNSSKDEKFLNGSWNDLKTVGHFDNQNNIYPDGLNFTFAGSLWNDSQVDWYRTLLWPTMVKAFAGINEEIDFKFNSKFLGIIRTHHWGLALPFASPEQTKINPITGIRSNNPNKTYDYVNPMPRAELLKSIVMAVHYDTLIQKDNVVNSNLGNK